MIKPDDSYSLTNNFQSSPGQNLNSIVKYANSVVETKLIPQYSEYKRQLSAKKAGFWKNVLDAGLKVAEIDAAPWTPKFYYDLIKAFSLTYLTTKSQRQELLTNKNQTFQFMLNLDQ